MGSATAEIDSLKTEMALVLGKLEEELTRGNREAVRHHLQTFEILAGELEDLAGNHYAAPSIVSIAWRFLETGRR